MGIGAILAAALGLAGVVIRPDTQALIDRSVSGIQKLVKSMIAGKKEPTPAEVAAMMARLDAGGDQWDVILGDWN